MLAGTCCLISSGGSGGLLRMTAMVSLCTGYYIANNKRALRKSCVAHAHGSAKDVSVSSAAEEAVGAFNLEQLNKDLYYPLKNCLQSLKKPGSPLFVGISAPQVARNMIYSFDELLTAVRAGMRKDHINKSNGESVCRRQHELYFDIIR
jgi:hypothetical protein